MLKMDEDVVSSLQRIACARGLTLSTAESCTGGAIAACLTESSGASLYYAGGVVAYSNHLKQSLLGVPANLIGLHGAVSEEVVSSMAKGVLSLTHTDYALAVSGIAGPTGGTHEKPVGTIWAAILEKSRTPISWKFYVKGNRKQVIEGAVQTVLLTFLDHLLIQT